MIEIRYKKHARRAESEPRTSRNAPGTVTKMVPAGMRSLDFLCSYGTVFLVLGVVASATPFPQGEVNLVFNQRAITRASTTCRLRSTIVEPS